GFRWVRVGCGGLPSAACFLASSVRCCIHRGRVACWRTAPMARRSSGRGSCCPGSPGYRFFGCGGEFAARTERHRLRLRRPFPVARQPVLVDDVAQCLAGRAGPARVATDGRCCGARPGVAGRHHFLWVVAGLARPLPRFQSVARIPCRDAQKEPIMTALIVSNIVLWVVTLALLLVVLARSRQIGVLYERVAPMGALTIDKGPAVGAASPRFELDDLLGRALRIGHGGARSQLLFFVSPTCPVCKKLLPILK